MGLQLNFSCVAHLYILNFIELLPKRRWKRSTFMSTRTLAKNSLKNNK